MKHNEGVALQMPISYVEMSEKEMCYTNGGGTTTYTTTAYAAKNVYTSLYWECVAAQITLAAAGGVVAGAGAALLTAIATGSRINQWKTAFENAVSSATSIIGKHGKTQKVRCTETFSSTWKLSISVKKV